MAGCVLFINKTVGRKNNFDSASIVRYIRSVFSLSFIFLFFFSQATAQGTWVPLTNTAPHYNEGVMLLLTDGTVLCKTSSGGTGYGTTWDRLTPDSHGSYVNGTWSTIAPMHDERLYFSTQVLLDGRVYVAGGEYGSGGPKSEVWDPKTNVWTQCPQIVTGHAISDANSELLPTGNVLQAVVDTGGTRLNYIYNPTTNSYSHTGSCLRGNNEAVWVKLPDNSIIFLDNYSVTSERYIPASGTWINDASAPVELFDPYGSEAGAGFLLPNGKVYFIGSTPTSAYYTPTGTTTAGSWIAGPALPNGWGAPDAASSIMPDGKILMALSPTPTSGDHFPDSTAFFQFDYTTNTYTALSAPGVAGDTVSGPSYITNMLSLPDGTILYTRQGHDQYFEYVPDSGPLAAGKPAISNIITNTCSNYTITGTLFNGISEGAAYGDDWQMSTNYPIVRLSSGSNVYYATTSSWNRPGAVMTGAALDTAKFDLPAGLPAGTYSVQVVADGNPSDYYVFTTAPAAISPLTAVICTGSTTSLTDTSGGGTWSSSNTAVGTVGTTGILTGITNGTTVVSYTVAGGCAATATVNVLVTPSAIGGIQYTGIGGTSLLTDAIPLGTWTSGSTSIATVNATTGQVTGVTAGTATITYTNICGFTTATYTVVPGTLCVPTGASPYASCNTYGIAFRTVNIVGDSGTAISDSLHCDGTGYIDRTALGCTLHDGSTYTAAITTQLNAAYTQFWIDFNRDGIFQASETVGGNTPATPYTVTAFITIPATAAPGTYRMRGALTFSGTGHHYPTLDPCISGYSSGEVRDYTVTIIPAPALQFTGTTIKTVCENSTANDITANLTINDLAASGSETWSVVSGPAHGTLGGFPATGAAGGGSVTPTGCSYTPTVGYAGVDVFTVLCTDGGGSTATQVVNITVTALANPGTISGTTNVCVAATTALSTTGSTGGTWTSSTLAVGSVSTSGVVRGISAGTTSISYAVSNSCGPVYASVIVTVNTTPSAGSVSGASSVCPTASITLSDVAGGGVWSSTSTTTATVGTTGLVTGVAAGTTTISYTVTTACGTAAATKIVTVNATANPGSITGTTNVCVAATTALSTTGTTGGTWTSTNPGVGSVSAAGVVRGISAGTTTISYGVSNTCGTVYASAVITVNPTPSAGTINGASSVCPTSSITLSDVAGGGVWSSTSTTIATIGTGGLVTGVAAGTTTISYTVTNGCGTAAATTVMTVNAAPSAGTITGTANVCVAATTALSTTGATGGTWTSTNPAVGSVSTSGVVLGLSAGTTTISYGVGNTCGTVYASVVITVNPTPAAGSISGASTVCGGASVTLSDLAGGGVWSSTSTTTATVGTGGLVTGVAAGTSAISYTVTNSCGTAAASTIMTVNAAPSAGTIVGTANVCVVGTLTLSATGASGGTWSSTAPAIGSVSSSGVVQGLSVGTTTISYGVSNTCGTAYASLVVTVNTTPVAGTISGASSVCGGASIPLSDIAGGGVWSSTSTTTATVGTDGLVTGVAVGTTTISYTVTNGCGTAAATAIITVNAIASAGSISGASSVCTGASIALSDVAGGGVWSSTNTAAATIGTDGLVTGVAAGTTTISYTITFSCGTVAATAIITVNATPVPGSISGASTLCSGASTTLSDLAVGGVWSSTSTSAATVGTDGLVTGVAVGTTTISYTVTNGCGVAAATVVITVDAVASAGSISGASSVCASTYITLSDVAGGGVWSSTNTAAATIGTDGMVTGVAAGTTTISFTVTFSCGTVAATAIITVNANPVAGSISGASTLCSGASTTLSDIAVGGVWSSTNPSAATIGTSGLVTGAAIGATTISYTVTNGCGTVAATKTITVNAASSAGSISGASTVCTSASITLSDITGGGVWSSTNTTAATIGSTGLVTGVAVGATTISYVVTNGCGTVAATAVITVNPAAAAGSVLGASTVAVGSNITLSDAVSGGTWSASNANATVAAGVVHGVTAGSVTISYAVTNSCGTATATKLLAVGTSTATGTVSPITGYFFYLCVGATAPFFDATAGGVWSVDPADAGFASVSATGVVSGISAGTAHLSYTVGASSATATVNVFPVPAAITGTGSICAGLTTTLSDATAGGVWSSGTASVASINSAGVVSASVIGVTPIYYTLVAPGGCRAAFIVTVVANPAGITGPIKVCIGSSISLSDATVGGAWSGTNSYASVDGSGDVLGLSAGSVIVTYSSAAGCIKTTNITVNIAPVPISGTLAVCTGAKTFVSDLTTPGASWTSSTTSVATITASGAVAGITTGTSTITYTLANGCTVTGVVSVNPTPAVTAILGASSVSHAGAGITLSDLTGGGIWSSSNTAILTVGSSTGLVTAHVSSGSANINYVVTNGFNCSNAATKVISATAAPQVHGGSASLIVGATISLADDISNGEWTSSDNSVATVDANGAVTALAAGLVTITHTATGSDGASSAATTQVLIDRAAMNATIQPNPNNGTFVVKGILSGNEDADVTIEITNMLGQSVYSGTTKSASGVINQTVKLGNTIANGMYLLKLSTTTEQKVLHFVIE